MLRSCGPNTMVRKPVQLDPVGWISHTRSQDMVIAQGDDVVVREDAACPAMDPRMIRCTASGTRILDIRTLLVLLSSQTVKTSL